MPRKVRKEEPRHEDFVAELRERSPEVAKTAKAHHAARDKRTRCAERVKHAHEALHRARNRLAVAESAGNGESIPVAKAEASACQRDLDAALESYNEADAERLVTHRNWQQAREREREAKQVMVRSRLAAVIPRYNAMAEAFAPVLEELQTLQSLGKTFDPYFSIFGACPLPTLPWLFVDRSEATREIGAGRALHFQSNVAMMTLGTHAQIMQNHISHHHAA